MQKGCMKNTAIHTIAHIYMYYNVAFLPKSRGICAGGNTKSNSSLLRMGLGGALQVSTADHERGGGELEGRLVSGAQLLNLRIDRVMHKASSEYASIHSYLSNSYNTLTWL